MATDSTTSIYHLFSRSLLRLIAQKAALFPCIGFIDLPSYSIINESIIHLSSNDLQAASEQLQGIELENIRWYVNMESDSAGTVAFARFLENLYRSASYNPTVYIEYLTFEENPWLASRLEEGFVVSRFSRVTEKYIPSSVLSGSYSIVLYAYLLASARILQEQFIETLASDFNLNTFQKSLRLTQHNGERDVTEVAFYILFPLLELQRTAGITLVYNRLWDKLRADEKAYLEEQLAQGLDEISFFALLLNFSDIRFTDIQLNAQQFLLAADFEHIVKSTLPEDVRDKKNIALYMGQGRNWDELQLHPLYKLKIDRYLNYNPRWRQWLTNKINRPLVTLRDWRIFFIAAIQLHQASLAEFNQICGYEVIGPMEHDEYREQLYAAQSIVTAALKAAMQFYLLQHPEEEAINRALHETDITLFVDNHLSMAEQQKDVYSFLSKVAAAYNRLEHIAPAAARDISGLEFVSRYLEPQQCETISRHLKKLVAMLCELADAEIYLKALVDAFHELHYTGHNPSISVHNVLMDNKYHIYHRDVNFVRVARRSAKQLDMLIEQYGEVVRDKIVEEIKAFIRSEYLQLTRSPEVEEIDEFENAFSLKAINIQRIDALLKAMFDVVEVNDLERRAQTHLSSVLRTVRHNLLDIPEEHELFEHNFSLMLWDESLGDNKVIFLGLQTLLPKMIEHLDVNIEMLDPFTSGSNRPGEAYISLTYSEPYDEISLHRNQYPVFAQTYLDHYGDFILKLTDEAITAIERDAAQLRKQSRQVMLVTETDSGQIIGASNDRLWHFGKSTPEIIRKFMERELQTGLDAYKYEYPDYYQKEKMRLHMGMRKKWLVKRKWLVELGMDLEAGDIAGSSSAFIESLYVKQGLSPQEYIIYVGYPDSPLLKQKVSEGFSIRSGAVTRSVFYWPAVGFPEINRCLPINYFDLLAFALRYPNKLEALLKLVRIMAETGGSVLKHEPKETAINLSLVKSALQQQYDEADIDDEQLYDYIATMLSAQGRREALTESQIKLVKRYVHLLQELESIAQLKDNLLQCAQQYSARAIIHSSS